MAGNGDGLGVNLAVDERGCRADPDGGGLVVVAGGAIMPRNNHKRKPPVVEGQGSADARATRQGVSRLSTRNVGVEASCCCSQRTPRADRRPVASPFPLRSARRMLHALGAALGRESVATHRGPRPPAATSPSRTRPSTPEREKDPVRARRYDAATRLVSALGWRVLPRQPRHREGPIGGQFFPAARGPRTRAPDVHPVRLRSREHRRRGRAARGRALLIDTARAMPALSIDFAG